MDSDAIERIRTATFPVGRRGYDKREVDRFLTRLADWLERGEGDETRSQVIRDELKRVGEQTGKILSEAHAAAEQMRQEAETHATNARSEADAYAERARIEADEYSREHRTEADAYLERIHTEADAEAAELHEDAVRRSEEIAAQGAARRRQLEAEIADLDQRREGVLEDMERLSSQLVGTATEHRPEPRQEPAVFEETDAAIEELQDDEIAPPGPDEDEVEAYEDEIEDEDEAELAEVGGETMEWDAAGELADEGEDQSAQA